MATGIAVAKVLVVVALARPGETPWIMFYWAALVSSWPVLLGTTPAHTCLSYTQNIS